MQTSEGIVACEAITLHGVLGDSFRRFADQLITSLNDVVSLATPHSAFTGKVYNV